jgi:lipoate-protein ligase A
LLSYLELTLPSPAENLALDEALLLQAEAGRGGELLRIWEQPSTAVVLGSSGRVAEDVIVDTCLTDGVPILRRCSGGGTVLLGAGCLVFSLILAYRRAAPLADVTHSYEYILGRMSQALGARRAGCSDLAIDDVKISGNSQRRLRDHLLHHGTMLFDFDLSLMNRYLLLPQRQPDYRRARQHGQFVRNLALPRAELVACLRSAWGADVPMIEYPEALVHKLMSEKYCDPGWTWRR